MINLFSFKTYFLFNKFNLLYVISINSYFNILNGNDISDSDYGNFR